MSGSPWVLEYLYCYQMITQSHPKDDKRFLEKNKFYCLWQVHLAKNLPQAMHQIHEHYGSPWVYMSSHCHQKMITQQNLKGPMSEVTKESSFFSQFMPA